ncbi:uncharacterized protein LOC135847961 [Planococcus citri]|uniref:uncharacterized protein LOC135847961 n=1 Tax=Planococcus citri TaxID=170843 RepID=UPI0031F94882
MMETYRLIAVKFVLPLLMITCLVQASPWKSANSTEVSLDDMNISWPSENEIEACEKDVRKCAEFPQYPRIYIEELIRNGTILPQWFNGIEYNEGIGNASTNDDSFYYQPLCGSGSETLYPKGGKTSKGEFAYIIQMPDNGNYSHYRQGVEDANCENESNCTTKDNEKLTDVATGASKDYEYKCIKVICASSKFRGIDRNKNIVEDVRVNISCCCMCEYRKPKYSLVSIGN